MTENDPERLADARERDVADLQERSDRLAEKVGDAREDWERKRADGSIPGAPPHERSPARDDGDATESPEGGAPPPAAGPAESETASETSAGPPNDA